MNNKSKFEEWYNKWNIHSSQYCSQPEKNDVRSGWNACKKAVLKELKDFEGEYVCDVIDRIKDI